MNEMLTYIRAEQQAGRIMRPSVALQKLKANPAQFLRKYPIRNIFDCANSGTTNAHLLNVLGEDASRPGSIRRTGRMHDTEGFLIQNKLGMNGEGHAFQTHGVYTGQSSAAPVWYQLDGTGPAIMLTAKLTGCTFVARAGAAAGSVEVTHLQPDQENGIQLNTRMKGITGQKVYGRLKYDIDKRCINIIGVRVGNKWKVFAQKLDKLRLEIRSVTKIFPT